MSGVSQGIKQEWSSAVGRRFPNRQCSELMVGSGWHAIWLWERLGVLNVQSKQADFDLCLLGGDSLGPYI
jgi:hypothetical protein